MTISESSGSRLVPEMDVLDVVYYMGNTFEGSYAVCVRQLLVPDIIYVLCLA